jgi:hypothetical protein
MCLSFIKNDFYSQFQCLTWREKSLDHIDGKVASNSDEDGTANDYEEHPSFSSIF